MSEPANVDSYYLCQIKLKDDISKYELQIFFVYLHAVSLSHT